MNSAGWCGLSYAGKQLKVDVRCDKGGFTGLLVVQDWDLLQPLHLRSEDFEAARSRLGGLSEVLKTQPAQALGLTESTPLGYGGVETQLAARVQAALNVYLVQGPGLGELMFAGSVRRGLSDNKLLITLLTHRYTLTLLGTPWSCHNLVSLCSVYVQPAGSGAAAELRRPRAQQCPGRRVFQTAVIRLKEVWSASYGHIYNVVSTPPLVGFNSYCLPVD